MKLAITKKPREVHIHEPGPCLNCSTWMNTNDVYCPKCGQKRLDRDDMSFRHLVSDSFFDYFHFDSKTIDTLKPLLFRPGWLTLEFMKGKRKSFVEPFRLFLVISLIYFIILPFSGAKSKEPDPPAKNILTSAAKKEANKLHYSLQGIPIDDAERDSMRKEIDSIGVREYVEKHHGNEPGWAKLLMRQSFKIMVSTGQSFSTVLEHTASKLIFVLIPVFALLLKLFYLRRKRLYFEHMIFSLHLHSFFFLFLLLFMLAGFFVNLSIFWIVLVFLVYGFFALKRYYGQSTRKTLAKEVLITLSYVTIGLPVFFLLLILVALMSY